MGSLSSHSIKSTLRSNTLVMDKSAVWIPILSRPKGDKYERDNIYKEKVESYLSANNDDLRVKSKSFTPETLDKLSMLLKKMENAVYDSLKEHSDKLEADIDADKF